LETADLSSIVKVWFWEFGTYFVAWFDRAFLFALAYSKNFSPIL
jgi:hypothetical protein